MFPNYPSWFTFSDILLSSLLTLNPNVEIVLLRIECYQLDALTNSPANFSWHPAAPKHTHPSKLLLSVLSHYFEFPNLKPLAVCTPKCLKHMKVGTYHRLIRLLSSSIILLQNPQNTALKLPKKKLHLTCFFFFCQAVGFDNILVLAYLWGSVWEGVLF